MSAEPAQALTPTVPTPAEPVTEPPPIEGPSATTKLPKPSSKKQKLTTEPHGYIADKLATFVRAVKTLTKKLRKDKEKAVAAAGAPSSAESAAAPEAKEAPAAAAGPPAPATAPAQEGAREGTAPVAGIMQQVHHHEPADKLHEPLSTADKLKNAVVSTVEHVIDEAAAVQASLTGTAAEEVGKLRHESHEQQVHPQHGPAVTTTGGLPITEK